MRVVGIDPGSRITGYGVVEVEGPTVTHVASGTIRVGTGEFPQRLADIHAGIRAVLDEHRPSLPTDAFEMAVEQVFMHRNVSSALKLGHARGMALLAAVQAGLSVHEYSATRIKQAVSGRGHADKEQVQIMVRMLLKLDHAPAADAADALAVALCHVHNSHGLGAIAGEDVRRTRRRGSGSSAWRRAGATLKGPHVVIGWLRGRLVEKRPPALLLDVGGVGYELDAPMTTFTHLPEVGADVVLHVHQVVREDALLLFGFATLRDRDLFRMLLKVNGVGARIGLAILSGMDANALARCIWEGDTDSLSRLPGIGKKTAERLIVEMRDRIDKAPGMVGLAPSLPGGGAPPVTDDPVAEAVNALIALGLKPPDASRRVQAVASEGLACEEIVRRALQAMGR